MVERKNFDTKIKLKDQKRNLNSHSQNTEIFFLKLYLYICNNTSNMINLSGSFFYHHYAMQVFQTNLARRDYKNSIVFGNELEIVEFENEDNENQFRTSILYEDDEMPFTDLTQDTFDNLVVHLLKTFGANVIVFPITLVSQYIHAPTGEVRASAHACLLILDVVKKKSHYFNPDGIPEEWQTGYRADQIAVDMFSDYSNSINFKFEGVALACPLQSSFEKHCDIAGSKGLCATWIYSVLEDFLLNDDSEIHITSERLLNMGCLIFEKLQIYLVKVWEKFEIDFPEIAAELDNISDNDLLDVRATDSLFFAQQREKIAEKLKMYHYAFTPIELDQHT